MTHGAEFLLNAKAPNQTRVLIYLICAMEYDKEFLRINELLKNAMKKDLELGDEELDRVLPLVLSAAFVQQYRYVEIPDPRPYAVRKYNIEVVEDSYILKPDYFWAGSLSGYNWAYKPRRSGWEKSPFQQNESIRYDLKCRLEKEEKARKAAERKAEREAAKLSKS